MAFTSQLSQVPETSPCPGRALSRRRGAMPTLLGRICVGRDPRVGATGADCRSSGQHGGNRRRGVRVEPRAIFSRPIASNPRCTTPTRCCSQAMKRNWRHPPAMRNRWTTPGFLGKKGPSTWPRRHSLDLARKLLVKPITPASRWPGHSASPWPRRCPRKATIWPPSLPRAARLGVAAGANSRRRPHTRKTAPSAWPSQTRTKGLRTSTSPISPARQRQVRGLPQTSPM